MAFSKRPHHAGDDDGDLFYSRKKFKSTDRDSRPRMEPQQKHSNRGSLGSHEATSTKGAPSTDALRKAPSSVLSEVTSGLPPLPPIDESFQAATFTHKSSINTYDRNVISSASGRFHDVSYERLEFLGDAYLEVFASQIIWDRFSHAINAGKMSQIRELLVKNETLSEYSRAYGFDTRVKVGDQEGMSMHSKGNKGFNKVLGDVLEAYVAAVILSDPQQGFAVAEKWLYGLWAPRLHEMEQKYLSKNSGPGQESTANHMTTYNPGAKMELQRRIELTHSTKIQYESYQASVELKGDRLGQTKHFIAVYLTGYGMEKTELGRGEGLNKVEAGNWAANDAMLGPNKAIVDACAEECSKVKEKRRKEREARLAKELSGQTGGTLARDHREKQDGNIVIQPRDLSKETEKLSFASLLLKTAAKQEQRK
nr:double-strand-specific pac1 ribonuclease [Quercus suber]